ncbi:MAG TPA: hypothetical protein PLQ71_03480 [Nitrospira sp.]|nr:hypothetical protein [Nitrospira sp.]
MLDFVKRAVAAKQAYWDVQFELEKQFVGELSDAQADKLHDCIATLAAAGDANQITQHEVDWLGKSVRDA